MRLWLTLLIISATILLIGAAGAQAQLFAPAVNYRAGNYPFFVISADLDADNDFDLAVACQLSNGVSILLNNGDGTFQAAVNYSTGMMPTSIFSADFDGDLDQDMAVANSFDDSVSILLNNGNGTFQSAVNYAAGEFPVGTFSADFNGDDNPDLAVTDRLSDAVLFLLNDGDGTFTEGMAYLVGSEPMSVYSADFDNDGDSDLAVANSSSDDISILLSNGDGTFEPATNYAVGDIPSSVFSTDFDGDDYLDLGVANWISNNVSILRNNGDGTFQIASNFATGSRPISVFSADFDLDGDFDLAVANGISDDLSILLNNGDGTFDAPEYYDAGDSPKSVFSADFDGDGDMDLAVANNESNDISILMNLSISSEEYLYLPGDCNMREGHWPPHVWGNDITYLVQYFRNPPDGGEYKCLFDDFFAAADADGNCSVVGIDINPVFYYLMGYDDYDTVSYCEDFQPAWPTEADCPVEAPAEWPNCDPIVRDDDSPKDVFVEIWIGNQDGSPIEATIGEELYVDVYIQTGTTTWGGNLHIPLGTNNLYVDSLLSQDEGQFYDDMLVWDYKGFSVPFGSPPNPEGWSSQSFMVITNLAGGPGLYLHELTPTKMLSFAVKIVDNPALDGQTVDCFDIGSAKCSWPLFCGDTTGISDTSLPITINFSQVHFALPPQGYPYLAGDANMFNEIVDVGNPLTGPWRVGGDVTFLVNYFDITSGNQPCLMHNPANTDDYPGGPVNGYYFASADATGEGIISGGDVSRLVAYFGGTAEIKWYGWDKPDPQNYYPPMWLNNRGSGLDQPVPELQDLVPGWPNCQTPPGAMRVLPSNSSNK